MGGGLANGSRVAVIGGGVCGAATAAALLYAAHARRKLFQVAVFQREPQARAPLVLTEQCRMRLEALGCQALGAWRIAEPTGLEVIERIGASAASWLRPGGVVICEIGEKQGVSAAASFLDLPAVVRQDMTGRDRYIVAVKP